jgi:hypothetical protein
VARTLAGDTSYLYVIGGRTAAPALLGEVWRAPVLRNRDAPTMRPITASTAAGPGAGGWYYKVSALLANGDESLPSDEESVFLGAGERPAVRWGCTAGATKYRVYRTATADQRSNTETFLAEVTRSCSGTGAGTMTFADDGSSAGDTRKPLPRGALGNWVNTGVTLGTPRFDFQAKALPNATNDIVVVGGCTAASGTGCTTSTAVIEKLTFNNATDINPSGGGAAGSGLTARDRFGLSIASASTANVASGKLFLLVFGGETNGAEISGGSTVQGAELGNLAFSDLTGAPNNVGVGGWAEVIANQGFSEATRANNHTLFGRSGTLGSGPFSTPSNFILNLNAGVPPYAVGGTRFLNGEALFRAFIYVAGGFAADNSFTPTATVERFVY